MRISEAYWVDRYHRWQVNVQRDGKRKTFTSTLTGRKGKLEAERKADRWLEDPTSAETVQVGRLLDQYEEYLKGTKSAGHASQYCGFIRLYIRPVIGLIRINRLTEGDLQDVIDQQEALSQNATGYPGLHDGLAEVVPAAWQNQTVPGDAGDSCWRQTARKADRLTGRHHNTLPL